MGSRRAALWYYLIVILATVRSKNGVGIRLTEERWNHIVTSHLEIDSQDFKAIMDIVKKPDFILKGDFGELLAVKKRPRSRSYFVVPYREIGRSDGFVLTAYLTSDSRWLFQREVIWSKE